jgi:hypothetical protein
MTAAGRDRLRTALVELGWVLSPIDITDAT